MVRSPLWAAKTSIEYVGSTAKCLNQVAKQHGDPNVAPKFYDREETIKWQGKWNEQ